MTIPNKKLRFLFLLKLFRKKNKISTSFSLEKVLLRNSTYAAIVVRINFNDKSRKIFDETVNELCFMTHSYMKYEYLF